ncbi:long-chain fatty acid--CoA ligase [Natronococcus pandeyae]|uniref:Long-chain fatty acid--CoA ligase n=1 Tax=Natronococcus pandeyae TaxID=2055836 RepID=A0A8J8Q5X2_9EURY|nr:AMP-binding protein [Natronococcus pandeyae]TYL39662.1 long-chain fatty acid--CoA ligase [Natronococcus pandeyae]
MTLSLARRAERSPDRTAVVDISEEHLYAPAETVHADRVSYAELSQIVGRTAGALADHGVEPGDTVCLVTRNRVASIAFLFACRRLGATLAPISHRLTPTTVKRPFDALEPSLVVAEAAQRDLVRSIRSEQTATLDQLADADASTVTTPKRSTDVDAPLLALHGEPGRPVVAFSASAVEWNCISAIVTWGFSRNDSGIVLDPLSAPDGLFRVALPLLYVGGQLLLDRAFDPGDTLTAIDERDVALLGGRAAPIRELAAGENADALAGLERAICDHAADEDALETLLEHDVSVSSAYGLLECPTAMSRAVAEPTADDEIGRPILDCRARLVDDESTVLEGAAEGILQLSGPVVADGYVNLADTGDATGSREAKQEDGSNEEARMERGTDEADEHGSAGSADEDDDTRRFTDGWFDTGDRFRRDEDGVYSSH